MVPSGWLGGEYTLALLPAPSSPHFPRMMQPPRTKTGCCSSHMCVGVVHISWGKSQALEKSSPMDHEVRSETQICSSPGPGRRCCTQVPLQQSEKGSGGKEGDSQPCCPQSGALSPNIRPRRVNTILSPPNTEGCLSPPQVWSTSGGDPTCTRKVR